MARKANSVYFTPTLGGTTDWTLSAAVQGYNTMALAAMVNGGTYSYRAESSDLSQWEIGEGVYNSGTGVLTRATVLYNSSGTGTAAGQSGAGTKISFTVAPNVGVVELSKDIIAVDEANSFTYLQKAQARANIDVLKKNYIINGGMQISQENGTTAGTANNYYPADQFRTVISGTSGVVSVGQVASVTPGGSPNRIRATVTTADAAVASTDLVAIMQMIEGSRTVDLLSGSANAKTITLQFGVKAPAGTYCLTLQNYTATRSYVAEYVISGGEANTDVVKSVTIALDQSGTWITDATGAGLMVVWALMAGSSFQKTAGAWGTDGSAIYASSNQFNFMGTLSNVFELFDVQLVEGGACPSFRLPEHDQELRKCQRYFWQTVGGEILPMSGTLNSGALSCQFSSMPVPVTMRSDPAITLGTSPIMKVGTGSTNATAVITGMTAVATPHATLIMSITWSVGVGQTVSDAVVVMPGTTPAKFSSRM